MCGECMCMRVHAFACVSLTARVCTDLYICVCFVCARRRERGERVRKRGRARIRVTSGRTDTKSKRHKHSHRIREKRERRDRQNNRRRDRASEVVSARKCLILFHSLSLVEVVMLCAPPFLVQSQPCFWSLASTSL